jgi:hypothetical protein
MEIQEIFYELCERADSPKSLGLWLRYRMAPSELATATIDPLAYDHPGDFARDYACLAFLRKWRGLQTGTDLRAVALTSFSQAEKKCSETNAKLLLSRVTGQLDQTGTVYLARMQEIIARVWGLPTFEDLLGGSGWGPGSTASLRSGESERDQKMTEFPVSITRAAWPYFQAVIREDIAWLRALLRQDVWGPTTLLERCAAFREESRVLTVPKDAKTDRTIAAEPTGLIFLQKGIGRYLRNRLKRFGVDLDDQRINQNLAASAYGEGLATLDLASASDTICKEVVRLLCPDHMWRLLNRLRCANYVLDGKVSSFSKFSSMGNGFTFELESLIFYAAARAVVEDQAPDQVRFGVYGDDIVVPQKASAATVSLLEDLGFSVNSSKSFVDGPFFESCGKHYFQGIDVTPPYQKKTLDDSPIEYIRTANRLYEWILRCEADGLDMDRYKSLHAGIFRTRPQHLRKVKAEGFSWMEGDGFFKLPNPDILYKNGIYQLRYYSDGAPLRREAWRGGTYASTLREKANASLVQRPVKRTLLQRLEELSFLDRGAGKPLHGFDTLREHDGVLRIKKRNVPAWFRDHHLTL